jgi:hypothetical protein
MPLVFEIATDCVICVIRAETKEIADCLSVTVRRDGLFMFNRAERCRLLKTHRKNVHRN